MISTVLHQLFQIDQLVKILQKRLSALKVFSCEMQMKQWRSGWEKDKNFRENERIGTYL